ncbi:MAG: corrinoid protein [Candidatus Sumerlaeaceae bacterium]
MELLKEIADLVAMGHANAQSKYPPTLAGQAGVAEKVTQAISGGIEAQRILVHGLMAGMEIVGRRFCTGEIFLPEVFMASKAMKAGVELLKPHLASAAVPRRGIFVLGTVQGDVHDIGKNLVKIMVEGAGWEVVDLGTSVPAEQFVEAVRQHRPLALGLSALLTTTMQQMPVVIESLRRCELDIPVIVGGAPVSESFARSIGAHYGHDPQAAIEFLAGLN